MGTAVLRLAERGKYTVTRDISAIIGVPAVSRITKDGDYFLFWELK